MDIQDNLKRIFQQQREAIEGSSNPDQLALLEQISREVLKCFKAGRKLLLCGNGGSASDSQHIAAEFVGRFKRDRQALPAIALTTDSSILTAVGNDYGFDEIFSRQVEALGQKGDLLIAISTSGNSENVLRAVRAAKAKEMVTIGMSGSSGGKLKSEVDLCYLAASQETPHIQEVHITALHAISEVVEDVLFGS